MATEFKTKRLKVTNIGNGPRGINTVGGIVMVGKGETSPEIEMSEAEIALMQQGTHFIAKDIGEGQTLVRTDSLGGRASRLAQHGSKLLDLEERVAALEQRFTVEGGGASLNSKGRARAERPPLGAPEVPKA